MPYLIETYGLSLDGSKLLLKDIDTANVYNDKETATAQISVKIAEQKEDNNKLLGYFWYKTPYYSRTIKEAIECLQYRVNKMKTLL